jgi:enoyl-CoA hydratase/carnithine racemase
MGPGDAIFAGFADTFIPENLWASLIARLEATAEISHLDAAAEKAPTNGLQTDQIEIDQLFSGDSLSEIIFAVQASNTKLSDWIKSRLAANAPLAMAAAVALIEKARSFDTIEPALIHEYRFVHRIVAQGDFREGIRAAIIDKDKAPKWTHAALEGPAPDEIAAMLAPLGKDDWSWEGLG